MLKLKVDQVKVSLFFFIQCLIKEKIGCLILSSTSYYTIYVCVQTKISSLLKGSAINVVPWFDKKEKEKKNKNKEGDE